MSWKRLLSAGIVACVLSSSAMAVPSITVTPNQMLNGDGNRVWTVQVMPDGGAALPSSLAVELAFSHVPGSSALPVSIIDNAAIDVNTGNAGAANDSWYYNTTTTASSTILWNTTSLPEVVGDLTQNVGTNPFCPGAGCPADFNPLTAGHQTEGLYSGGANLFAALGSTIITAGTTSVNTLQIVTQGGGGILQMGAGVVGQINSTTGLEENYIIAAKNFYAPGDFTGDGRVGSQDVTDLILNFGELPAPGAFIGDKPNAGSGIVGSGDVTDLILNFNAGQTFGSGSAISSNLVPEPSSLFILLSGLAISAFYRRRRYC